MKYPRALARGLFLLIQGGNNHGSTGSFDLKKERRGDFSPRLEIAKIFKKD